MAKKTYPARVEFNGPWLIDRESLNELDATLKNIEDNLEKALNVELREEAVARMQKSDAGIDDLSSEVEKLKKNYSFIYQKKILISFESRENIKLESATSLKEALKDPEIKSIDIKTILVHFEYGTHNYFKLTIGRYGGNELEYELGTVNDQTTNEIRSEIEQWIDRYKPSRIVRIWGSELFFVIQVLLGTLLICFSIFSFLPSGQSYHSVVGKEAFQLADSGVNEQNLSRAVELLLRMESGYQPSGFVSQNVSVNPINIRIVIFLDILLIPLFIKPKTTIGLGRKKAQVNFYKFWIKFWTITAPVIIIIQPLWEVVINFIYHK